jgi:tRNA-2-methylthio-N6-dimethylallyladenosine synthase
MNEHDSSRMREVLERAGYAEVNELADAELVLVNTCSVREKAEQKLRSELGRIALLKAERPGMVIAVAGCVAQQEGERLLQRVPALDLVLGPDNIPELPRLLGEIEGGAPPIVRTVHDIERPEFLRAEPRRAPSAFVTVMKGCDERCSFCIVPHTRGPERYRPSTEVVEEIRSLVGAGVREITLLGQTVNSYRDPLGALGPVPGSGELPWSETHPTTAREDESEFAALLRQIAAQVPDLARLRYTSPHPRHLTMSLIRAHAELPMLARHAHLPVQSGSDRVLRRMIRRYSVAEYLERVQMLKSLVPGITLSTDVIVGFPGETPGDFQATLDLVERVGFTSLFGFKYSVRPYTPALKLEDDVPELEKSERLAQLFELSQRLKSEHLTSLVDTEQAVLCEGSNKNGYSGRSEQNEIVHFGARRDPSGEIVRVKIVEAFKNSLRAECVDPALRAPLPERKVPRELRVLS